MTLFNLSNNGAYASYPAANITGSSANNENEWGEFLHLPGEKFYDFAKIRAEIVRDTELKTGKNAGTDPTVHGESAADAPFP